MGIDSPYLFVSQIGERPYRGSAVLRELAEEAQVSDLSLFTATSLRKQLATLSQFLEISKFNQDHLATYLGRSQKHILSACGSCSFLFKVNTGVKVHESVDDNRAGHDLVDVRSPSWVQVEHAQDERAQFFTVLVRDGRERPPHDLQD